MSQFHKDHIRQPGTGAWIHMPSHIGDIEYKPPVYSPIGGLPMNCPCDIILSEVSCFSDNIIREFENGFVLSTFTRLNKGGKMGDIGVAVGKKGIFSKKILWGAAIRDTHYEMFAIGEFMDRIAPGILEALGLDNGKNSNRSSLFRILREASEKRWDKSDMDDLIRFEDKLKKTGEASFHNPKTGIVSVFERDVYGFQTKVAERRA